jgi:hypothetical protein
MKAIETQVGDENPEVLAELKKSKDLQSVKNIDKELSTAKDELRKAKKQLNNLGFLGKAFSGFGETIINKVEQS